jgi:predicted DNA-binding transcriptional regulator AlpA
MFASPPHRDLLRWLLRELSTDPEDMIIFVASLPDADDDDAQALLEEINTSRAADAPGPLRALYQDGSQLLGPTEAMAILNIPRASFYALLKRGTFPAPVSFDEAWIGWPRDMLLEWADTPVRLQSATCPHPGYAPFERFGAHRAK